MQRTKYDWVHFQSLITLAVVGSAIGPHPACSAAVVLVLFAYRVADKYFHDSFHDENRQAVAQLRADLQKIKLKQDHSDLKSAFGGVKGG